MENTLNSSVTTPTTTTAAPPVQGQPAPAAMPTPTQAGPSQQQDSTQPSPPTQPQQVPSQPSQPAQAQVTAPPVQSVEPPEFKFVQQDVSNLGVETEQPETLVSRPVLQTPGVPVQSQAQAVPSQQPPQQVLNAQTPTPAQTPPQQVATPTQPQQIPLQQTSTYQPEPSSGESPTHAINLTPNSDPLLSNTIHPDDLDSQWNSWKCLVCSYVYEGQKPLTKCPRCKNEDPDKFDDPT